MISSLAIRISILIIAIESILIFFIDRPIATYVHSLDLNQPSIINFFRSFTDFGKSQWSLWPCFVGILVCSLGLHFRHLRKERAIQFYRLGNIFMMVFLMVALSGILTDCLKPLLGRARPIEFINHNIFGLSPISFSSMWNSFPSGHSTSVFALAFALTRIHPRLMSLWFLLALSLAISRIMVNAHYLSDVVGGFIVAWIIYLLLPKLLTTRGINHAMQCIFPIDSQKPLR